VALPLLWLLYQRVFFWSEPWRAQPLAVLSKAASSSQAGKRELMNSFTAGYFFIKSTLLQLGCPTCGGGN
jgi:hypothetical protein